MNQLILKHKKKQTITDLLTILILISLLLSFFAGYYRNAHASEQEPQTESLSESTAEPRDTSEPTPPESETETESQKDEDTQPSVPGQSEKPSESTKPTPPPPSDPTEPDKPTPVGMPYLLVGENAIIRGKAGEKVKLVLPLLNLGNAAASNITASPLLSNEDEIFPFEIEKSEYIRSLRGSLDPVTSLSEIELATKKIDFGEFMIRENLDSGYYKVSFKINYRYPGNHKIEEIERYFFIRVEASEPSDDDLPTEPPVDPGNSFDPGSYDGGYYGDVGTGEEQNKSTPRLLISGFSTNPEKLFGGKEFTLHLKLRNTSKDFSIKNIKLTLSSQGEEAAVFLPVSGASTIYLESIDKDTEKTIDIALKCNSSVEQKVHPLDIKFEYEDNKGNPYTSEEMISIMVYQELRCEVGKIEIMPNPIYVGNESNIMFSIHNKGKATLYNLSVIIPEGSPLEATDYFVGNIEAGTSKDVDFIVNAIASSLEPEIPFEISFEDAEGNISTLSQSMPLTIEENMEIDPGMNGDPNFDPNIDDPGMIDETVEKPGLPWYAYLMIGGAVLIGVIILTGVLKKRKRKKEQAEIDEMV